jgi:pimeloyl-ACP methyl ester carboxylesterase
MSPPREESLTIAGCRTHLLRAGEGPPLLYLHGASGGGTWAPFLRHLSRRFEVIAPEHPGFGRSDTPDWFDSIHDLAYFYLEFMQALGLRGAHVVGSSLGGWIAAEAAVRSTERMASLVLIGAAGIHLKGVPRPDTFLWTPEEAVRNLFHDPVLAEALLAMPAEEAELDRQLKNRFAAARVGWSPRWHNPHLEKWLHRITVPTLVAWGREDRVLPVAYAAGWGERIPSAEVVVFDACGHLPQIEQSQAFCAALDRFLGRVAP